MPSIARRNLFQDKIKLGMALVGIVFSVGLVTLQIGLLLGAMRNCSGLIDHAGADVWVMQKSTRNLDLCDVMQDRRFYQVTATPGVAWGERLIVQFTMWKLPDGRQENTTIVGLQPDSRLHLPWDMALGRRSDLWWMDGVIIDQRERWRFGQQGRPLALNDTTEIYGHRARVVGFCRGVGSFTTSPYVFTDYKRALDFCMMTQRQTKYVVLKASPGISPEELRDRVRALVGEVDVYTAAEFSFKTRWFWMYGTGMGLGISFGALLGMLVGIVIVGQTMYSATIERLREYGTLKALGMSNVQVAGIIVRQALFAGMLGYVIASGLAFFLGRKLPALNVPVEVPLALIGAMFFVTVLICISASVTSVLKVFRLEPAIVFRSERSGMTRMAGTDSIVMTVRDLHKSYGEGAHMLQVLHGIHLAIARSEMTLLMGPSGSGKTTLLTIMGLLLRPTSGQVFLNGRDVTQLDESQLPALRRDHIGFIFQGFNLLSALNAAENVEVVLGLQGLRGRPARKRARELLEIVGLAERWDHLPEELSGGEKQRVAVARALASPAELILADEPTGNLDSKTAAQVVDILRDLTHRQNRAVLVVTHDPALRRLADRILYMRDGRLADSPEALDAVTAADGITAPSAL